MTSNLKRGGYDVLLSEQCPKDLFCPLCLLVMRNAVQFRCRHGMCESCYENLKESADSSLQLPCPECREEIEDAEVAEAGMINRMIMSLKIKCKSSECNWAGEISDNEIHLGKCEFELVKCNNIGCSEEMCRNMLDDHLKTCSFKTTGNDNLLQFMLSRLDEQEKKIFNQEKRLSDLTKKCQDQDREILALRSQVSAQSPSYNTKNLEHKVQKLMDLDPASACFVWNITNFVNTCEMAGDFFSPVFMTSFHGYKCRMSMVPGRSRNSKTIRFMVYTEGDGAKRHFHYKVILTFCGRQSLFVKALDAASFKDGVPPLLWYNELTDVLSGSKLRNFQTENNLKIVCNFLPDIHA